MSAAPEASTDAASTADPSGTARYEIRVRGHLGAVRAASFDGFTVEREADGSTRLVSEEIDQAALHGILRQIRDLGLPLLSVARLGVVPDKRADRGPTGPGEEEDGP